MLLKRRAHIQAPPTVDREAEPLSAEMWPPPKRPPLAPLAVSCCCPAAAVVQAVMPASEGLDAQDLLLCHHHARVSRTALLDAGAVLYDAHGYLLEDGSSQQTAKGGPDEATLPPR
ncbi:MAG: DUF7455 domain-containing protein [Actinomycetes bacterium]